MNLANFVWEGLLKRGGPALLVWGVLVVATVIGLGPITKNQTLGIAVSYGVFVLGGFKLVPWWRARRKAAAEARAEAEEAERKRDGWT